MHCLSTRTAATARSGLAAGIDELAAIEPPALFLEASGDPGSLAGAEAAVRRAGRPIVGVLGPVREGTVPAGGWPTLDAPRPEDRRQAAGLLVSTLPFLARVRCRRLVTLVGDGGVEGAAALRTEAAASTDGARVVVRRWKEQRRRQREAALEALCRAADHVARAERATRLLLMPGADPAGLLDPETAAGVLDDVPGGNLGLALDVGMLALREARGGEALVSWWGALAPRVELVLLSDTDGASRSDLLPGLGRVDYSALREVIGRSAARVLRPDPDLPLLLVREADRVLAERLGGAL